MIKLEYKDAELQAMAARIERLGGKLKPALRDIGEYLVRSTKQRFAEGKAPDGTPWAPNTETTLIEMLRRRGGDTVRRKGEKSSNPYYRQDGRVNKRGANLISGKKPLVGESKRLSGEISYRVSPAGVEIGSSLEYAATQQFGAKTGSFGRNVPWGDIPARPFLGLSDGDKKQVMAILQEHLDAAMR